METLTSPPAARIRLMRAAASVSLDTARVPSQVGEQPPPLGARMNANWNAFWPVAFITVTGSGGLLSKGIRYGAEAYQLLVSAALAGGAEMTIVAATASALAPIVPSKAKLRRCMVLTSPGWETNC